MMISESQIKQIIREEVRAQLIEHKLIDNPEGGGLGACRSCGAPTQWGTCAQCQPHAYLKLP